MLGKSIARQILLVACLIVAAATRTWADNVTTPTSEAVAAAAAPEPAAPGDGAPAPVQDTSDAAAGAAAAAAASPAGGAAVAALQAMPAAAVSELTTRTGLSAAAIEQLLASDPSLHLHPSASTLTYACSLTLPSEGAPGAAGGPAAAAAAAAIPPFLALAAVSAAGVSGSGTALAGDADPGPERAFLLHSRAGAQRTIYRDFNGAHARRP